MYIYFDKFDVNVLYKYNFAESITEIHYNVSELNLCIPLLVIVN